MKQSPSCDVNSYTTSQAIPRLLLKLGVRVQKSQTLDSVLGHMNPAHTLTPFFFQLQFNTNFPFKSSSVSIKPKYCPQYPVLNKVNNNSVQFCIYLRAELNSQWTNTKHGYNTKTTTKQARGQNKQW
jgi:hypothetical protein